VGVEDFLFEDWLDRSDGWRQAAAKNSENGSGLDRISRSSATGSVCCCADGEHSQAGGEVNDEQSIKPTSRQATDEAGSLVAELIAIGARSAAELLMPGGGALFDVFGTLYTRDRDRKVRDGLEYIKARLAALEISSEKLTKILESPTHRALLFDGLNSAGRVVSDDRLEHIARIVADGLTDDELHAFRAKRMLAILDQVDDEQLIILGAAYIHGERPPFGSKPGFDNILMQPTTDIVDDGEARAKRLLDYKLARVRLGQIGLVEYGADRVGDTFRQHHDHPYGQRIKLTILGEVLMERLGFRKDSAT